MPKTPNLVKVQVTGLLEYLNGHGQMIGRVRDASGKAWPCDFRRLEIPLLRGAWMHLVQVSGVVDASSNSPHVDVDSLEIISGAVLPGRGGTAEWNAGPVFESSPTIEELAVEQGVQPIRDVDAVSDLWPCDDEPEELLAFVLDEGRSS